MALSVAVMVGETKNWIPEIVEKARNMKVGPGTQEGVDIAPMCYPELRDRVKMLIGTAEKEGAKLLLDGRNCKIEGYPNGFWVGPTVIDEVTADMTCYKEEIFGPVLSIVHVDTLDDAIEFINKNQYGNGTGFFTRSGAAARKY